MGIGKYPQPRPERTFTKFVDVAEGAAWKDTLRISHRWFGNRLRSSERNWYHRGGNPLSTQSADRALICGDKFFQFARLASFREKYRESRSKYQALPPSTKSTSSNIELMAATKGEHKTVAETGSQSEQA